MGKTRDEILKENGLILDDCIIGSLSTPSRIIYMRDVIELGKAYPIDDYILRFVYKEDSTEPTHFVITKFGMPKPLAEDAGLTRAEALRFIATAVGVMQK